MTKIALKQINFNEERQLLEFDVVDEDGLALGFAQLRLNASKATDMPAGFESNIYYEITPDQQGKGYATKALQLLLNEASQHNLAIVIATVNVDNTASIRVLEKNGAELQSRGMTLSGKEVLKYSIATGMPA